MLHPERLVKPQLAYAEIFVELDHILHKFFCCRSSGKIVLLILQIRSNTAVEHLAAVIYIFVVRKNPAAVGVK